MRTCPSQRPHKSHGIVHDRQVRQGVTYGVGRVDSARSQRYQVGCYRGQDGHDDLRVLEGLHVANVILVTITPHHHAVPCRRRVRLSHPHLARPRLCGRLKLCAANEILPRTTLDDITKRQRYTALHCHCTLNNSDAASS
jgi:hypothetical protein